MKVYLDNAATTPIDKEVLARMVETMESHYGNPSSIHSYGRASRSLIETSRKTVAKLLGVAPAEIFFTSGGTEADNMAIRCGIHDHGIKHAISSPLEHHAVLHTLEELEKAGEIKLNLLNVDAQGHIDYDQLEELLKTNERSFVSLMHGNNEIGTMLDIDRVANLCEQYHALFHCDTVQTIGHFAHDFSKQKIHFAACAAHKLHGPKGVGFIYVSHTVKIHPLIYGGSQERNMRGGTENLHGIVGLAKALEIACMHLDDHMAYIQGIKSYMKEQLEQNFPDICFNGDTTPGKSLCTVLNVSFPESDMGDMLLFNLDIHGISASGGSACTSGSDQGSHVLRGLCSNIKRPSVRFSFSKYTTKEEIDFVIEKLKQLIPIPISEKGIAHS